MEKYKEIIKSRRIRKIILKLFFWVPTRVMLKIQYKIKMGFWPNFKKPTLYSEKLQLYKMKYRNPVMKQIADKSTVHKYLESKGLETLRIKNLGNYNKFEDINFEKLPNSFVIKASNGGGGNDVIIVEDKSKINKLKIKQTMQKWPRKTYYREGGREWCYGGLKTKIVVEELLRPRNDIMKDYKFFCFNGKVEYFYVTQNRRLNSDFKGDMIIYDKDFKKTLFNRVTFNRIDSINLPTNIEEMVTYAEILSEDFPHARVDLYNIDGNIYFGEITFYNASGYAKYSPSEFDRILGDKFTLYNDKKGMFYDENL